VSSQQNSQNAVTSSDPTYGVRNRSEHSRRIHRIDPDSDDLEPACCRKHEDAEFKRCHIGRLTAFNRFDRCQNPECFGEDPDATEDEKELIADGGHPAEHHLDSAADQLEIVLRGFDADDADRIRGILNESLRLENIAVRRESR